jgi:DNA-binding CsgD family transcriptional regulator
LKSRYEIDAFSRLLRDLYRLAAESPAGQFRHEALQRIRTLLPFDSALWASGSVRADGPHVHALVTLDQPPEMMENYERIKQHDVVFGRAFASLGTVINVDNFSPEMLAVAHPDAMEHCRRFGMAHVLAVVDADLVAGLFFAVSLYRAESSAPFAATERDLTQALVAHFPELVGINHLRALDSSYRGARTHAVCDRAGFLYHAEQDFSRRLRLEWPEWRGPQLPLPLCEAIMVSAEGRWRAGRAVAADWRPYDQFYLLSLRDVVEFDRLSPREIEIARAFASGAAYGDIARTLRIAPTTVRNHLSNIYAKLSVHSKAELVNALRDAET